LKLFEIADRDPDRRNNSKLARTKKFDTSGKSPAYIQHRKIWPAPGNRSRAFSIGHFESDGGRIQDATSSPRIAA
jgi:hypothetical protein